jgi:hypothetical protein
MDELIGAAAVQARSVVESDVVPRGGGGLARAGRDMVYGCLLHNSRQEGRNTVAADYDDLRPEVRESQQDSLAAVKSANAPDPRSVVRDLDSEEYQDDAEIPGGEFVDGELTVHLVPQGEDEFVCQSCFLVRHRSQIARTDASGTYCHDCEA